MDNLAVLTLTVPQDTAVVCGLLKDVASVAEIPIARQDKIASKNCKKTSSSEISARSKLCDTVNAIPIN